MSVIAGTVLDVKIDTDIKGRSKTYKGYQVAYRTDAGEIRTLEKAMQSLTYTPSVREALQGLVVGDRFHAVLEKEGDFLNVKSLAKGDFSGSELPPQTSGAQSSSSSGYTKAPGKVVGNTYETPEERKLKQRLIVRQAAINQALEYSQDDVSINDILARAEHFENWVYRGLE